MTRQPLESLCTSAHRATAAAAVYSLVLVWLVRPPSGPGSNPWGLVDWPWMGPVLLLLVQTVAVAGLIQLVHAFRGLARRLERREVALPRGLRPFRTAAPPLAFAVGVTAGILGAARGLGFLNFMLWSFTPGVVALALWRLAPLLPGESRVRPDTDRLVSRLRGASLATTVAGMGLFLVSGSLAAGALLPLVMLREIPRGPPPTALDAPWDTGAGGGGGGASELRTAATAAGQAIQTLLLTGSPRGLDPLELPPVRRPPAWWAGEAPPLPLPPHEWARSLHGAAERGEVPESGRAFMRAMARHPANREFDALAEAARADIAGARWKRLDGRTLASFELPVPRYVELWSGVRGRIAGAFHLASAGQEREARRRLSTVVHLGRLMYTDGPLTLDAVVGSAIAREGSMALDALEGTVPLLATDTPLSSSRPSGAPGAGERLRWLGAHREAVGDPTLARGIRWEGFMLTRTFQPCASLSAVLWGPSEEAEARSRDVVQALAAYPSERAMAEVLTEGYLGTRAGADGWGWLPKVLGLTLGQRPVVSHCAPLAAAALE